MMDNRSKRRLMLGFCGIVSAAILLVPAAGAQPVLAAGAQTVLGACCVDGACTDDLTEEACEALCGLWIAGRDCDNVLCPVCISGVCCIDGECFEDFAGCDSCRCAGGMWLPLPMGEDCDPNPCPPLTGACCVDGACTDDMTEEACDAQCGLWMPNADCADVLCPVCIAGVCCIAGECFDDFAGCDSCRCAGGFWLPMPMGQGCDPNPCPQPTGACCVDGACTDDMTEEACEALCGLWIIGADCDDVLCPVCIYGVCCINGDCFDDFAGCDSCRCAGGFWLPMPMGQGCDPNPCPPPTGACCVDGACTDDMTEEACDALCGLWIPSADCDDVLCPVCIYGVCCIDVECFEDFAGCDSCRCAGGYWLPMPMGQGCVPNPCVPPVCPGDSNCDEAITWRDIDFFVAAMNDNVAAWEAMFWPGTPTCLFANNDVNDDGTVNWRDIDPFVAVMNTTCP
ncbi:MAG: hypothetical protein KAY37_09080 [Phycisphaerae bacterium]|nr:hypothetical protein [Phycisphaerae bacterium]